MNATLQTMIAVLIALGILISQIDGQNLDSSQETQSQQKVVTDDPFGF